MFNSKFDILVFIKMIHISILSFFLFVELTFTSIQRYDIFYIKKNKLLRFSIIQAFLSASKYERNRNENFL